MAFKDWSATAADNDDADATINWAEGQAPSTVNGSARAMMAVLKNATGRVVSVKDFGAVGDGVTDDSVSILAAVNDAAGQSVGADASRASVYFPPGVYVLGTSAQLTPTVSTSLQGIHFFGAGLSTSILRLSTSGSDLYFYNNGSTARTLRCTFSDLGFEGLDPAGFTAYTDISDNAKGFRLWATTAQGAHEQGFKFTRCRFDYLAEYMDNAGDNTSSECSFVQCEFQHIKNVCQKIDNLQSFNHEYYGCNFLTYGDVFSISGNGGGAIKMWGGSVVMLSDKASDVYFFKQSVAGSGTNAFPFVFNGIRFEFRGNTTNIASLADTAQVDLNFDKCFMLTTASANLSNYCKAGRSGRVFFRGCTFKEQSTGLYQFHITTTVKVYESGLISFDGCGVPIDWSDRCFLDASSGHIRAIDCYGTNVGAIGTPRHFAHDFDVRTDETAGDVSTWEDTSSTSIKDSGSGTGVGIRLKMAQVKLASEFWPDITEHGLRLPRNAIIKNIHLRKPAGGADATSVTFRVGRADKSGTDHLTSNTAQMNATHTGDTTNYFYCVGSTDNERNILLYTDENPSAVMVGGICIVEYY